MALHTPESAAGVRPPSDCPLPAIVKRYSRSTRPRPVAWSRRRCARRGGVLHLKEYLHSGYGKVYDLFLRVNLGLTRVVFQASHQAADGESRFLSTDADWLEGTG